MGSSSCPSGGELYSCACSPWLPVSTASPALASSLAVLVDLQVWTLWMTWWTPSLVCLERTILYTPRSQRPPSIAEDDLTEVTTLTPRLTVKPSTSVLVMALED